MGTYSVGLSSLKAPNACATKTCLVDYFKIFIFKTRSCPIIFDHTQATEQRSTGKIVSNQIKVGSCTDMATG